MRPFHRRRSGPGLCALNRIYPADALGQQVDDEEPGVVPG